MALAVKVVVKALGSVAHLITLAVVEELQAQGALALLPGIINSQGTVTAIPVAGWTVAHLVTVEIPGLCSTLLQRAVDLGELQGAGLAAEPRVVTKTKALEIRGVSSLMASTPIVAGHAGTAAVGMQAAFRPSPPRQAGAARTQRCGPAAATIEAGEFPAGEHALTADA